MKIIVTNPDEPRGAFVRDYPVSVASTNSQGEYATNKDTGEYVSTGETLEWTIRPGEALKFEEYVAKTLTDRYHFLGLQCEHCGADFHFEPTDRGSISAHDGFKTHKCEAKEDVVAEVGEATGEKFVKVFRCKYCTLPADQDKEYKNKMQLAMHIGSKHQDVDF